ncbi:uncharacterized protein LOC120296066 [Eucalyptus grandis]|uniref:uncharacterized protein LOC120296066 n=1 Tax=Eucalyptus grandis TaxID=71139 RepID=UPI00192EAB6B|nr:uncharacterized protein LOC120296066 [Eucalyptus grandis]
MEKHKKECNEEQKEKFLHEIESWEKALEKVNKTKGWELSKFERAILEENHCMQATVDLELHIRWNPRNRNRHQDPTDSPVKWVSPPKGSLKYNVDGSWKEEQRERAMVGICRNEQGILIDGFAEKIAADSALKTEALALLATLLKLVEARKRKKSLAGKREKSSASPELTYNAKYTLTAKLWWKV